MAKFFVGQRVRIVRNLAPVGWYGTDSHAGAEHTIAAIANYVPHHGLPEFNIILRGVRVLWFCADELEPVTPSGHRASEFSFTELMERCREGVSA